MFPIINNHRKKLQATHFCKVNSPQVSASRGSNVEYLALPAYLDYRVNSWSSYYFNCFAMYVNLNDNSSILDGINDINQVKSSTLKVSYMMQVIVYPIYMTSLSLYIIGSMWSI
jgi:hypothetical protein